MTKTTILSTTCIATILALAACTSTTTTTGSSSGSSGTSDPNGADGGVTGLPGGENGAAGIGTLDRPGFGDVHLAAGKDGSMHMVFVDGASSATWYARCEASCGDPASWNPVKLAPNAIATGYQNARGLAVDGSGRVHMLLVDSVYATCASGCDEASSWTFTSLDALEPGGEAAVFKAFDASPSGALSYMTRSGNYFTCASGCTDVSSWKPVARITGTPLRLRVDGKGGVHVLMDTGKTAQGERVLSYARCTSACDQQASWALSEKGFLARTESYGPSLAASASGRVFVTYQQGTLANAADPNNGKLVVASCAGADCTNLDKWTSFGLAGAEAEGNEGTWVEASGESALLVSAAGGELHLRTCDGGCQDATGWSEPTVVDASSAIAATLPPQIVACGGATPESASYEARFPSAAIGSKGVVVVHQPRALVKCPGDPNIKSSAPVGRVLASF